MQATAKAHTNIALIKYWGMRNEALKLPMNNSLSLTLDALYTTTTVDFQTGLEKEIFYLNEKEIHGTRYRRNQDCVQLIMHKSGKNDHDDIQSLRTVH